jgi:transposase
MPGATQTTTTQWRYFTIMRAFDPEVVDAVWAAVEPLLPVRPSDTHPLGCHRRRVADRDCFEAILVRLATGCAWITAEAICGHRVSDTTLRGRRDEWVAAGVFDALAEEALHAYDRIIGLDLTECSLDGSTHKAPCGGEGTGKNPTDRGKLGWKWSLLCDRAGIPVGWATTGANRHDSILVPATLDAVAERGLLDDIETLHLDRGYDSRIVRDLVAACGIDDLICAQCRPAGTATTKLSVPLGMRWPIERTNSWLANYGQLRRSTDLRILHRLAQIALTVAVLLTAKLIDWRKRWAR